MGQSLILFVSERRVFADIASIFEDRSESNVVQVDNGNEAIKCFTLTVLPELKDPTRSTRTTSTSNWRRRKRRRARIWSIVRSGRGENREGANRTQPVRQAASIS